MRNRYPSEDEMKLFDVPKGSRIRVGGVELTFHHLDGMYSYCTLDDGSVVHVAAWEDVEVLDEQVT